MRKKNKEKSFSNVSWCFRLYQYCGMSRGKIIGTEFKKMCNMKKCFLNINTMRMQLVQKINSLRINFKRGIKADKRF